MKKFFYLAMALSLVACQAEKVDVGGDMGGDGEKNYISVNIVSANAGTRADDDGYGANGGRYEDGTSTENGVTSVRFYFFKNAANESEALKEDVIKNDTGGFQSYYDIETISGSGEDHSNSVERILNTVIVIDVKGTEGGAKPEGGDKADKGVSVVAVLNLPNDPNIRKEYASLAELNAAVADFNLSKTTNFVMSNSISAEGGKKIEAISLEGHLHPTEEAAKNNPVIIYVERVLAKVTLTTDMDEAEEIGSLDNVYRAKNKVESEEDGESTGEEIVIGGKDVYVHFLGWNVTTTTDKAYLMKSINPSWPIDLFYGGEPWNWAGIRSFWAINPTTTGYVWGPFQPKSGETKPNIAQAITGFKTPTPESEDPANFTYVQENAAVGGTGTNSNATAKPTQVIIAAQLVDEDGEDLEVAEYAGTLYAGTEAVKKLYANALSNVWVEVTNTSSDDDDDDSAVQVGQRKFVKVGPGNIDFKTATAVGKASETKEGRYYVYAVLKPNSGEDYVYYKMTTGNDGATEAVSLNGNAETGEIKGVNDALMDLGHAKVWRNGMTYYYFDIRHLAKAADDADVNIVPGYFGVVRNHVYKTTVTGLYGLGTPVYDPDEVIIPERPEESNTVIAAKIEILSWRIVNQNVELVW